MSESYIYRFKNAQEEIIYIGKSSSLETRMLSHNHLPKKCYEDVCTIEYTTFNTEDDITYAEIYYISKIKPIYNTRLVNKNISFAISELDDKEWHDGSFLVSVLKKDNKINVKSKKIKKIKEAIDGKHEKNIDVEIIKNYPFENIDVLAGRLGISSIYLKEKAKRLGVRREVNDEFIEETKKCTGCNRILSVNMFWKDKRRIDGISDKCKDCKREYYYSKRIEQGKTRRFINGENRNDINLEIIKYYPFEDSHSLSERLGISEKNLRKRASRLNIKKIVKKRRRKK